jgi:aminopeptidase N
MRFWHFRFLLIVISFQTVHPSSGSAADNSRSDSVDVLEYRIHLDVTDYTGKTISGWCVVSFKSKIENLPFIDLDLLQLNVDSVTQDGQPLAFGYNDTTLRVNLASVLHTGDSADVIVYYRGTPVQDSGGWGGWYWSGNLSFCLSVALTDLPHNFGRSWFPCVDNFVERATYQFAIVTDSDKMALCGGDLTSAMDNGDGTITWSWELPQTIPSYLAGVAVNNYAPAYGAYVSITGDTLPIVYGATAADTTKLKNSFLNLPAALLAFEQAFGPYRWSKVGYCITTVGAMEHATNIAYPNSIVNGQTTYESYMAHELSHHWFGNLVTCRTAEDMWLNEGWANFCAFYFMEAVYGKQKYMDEIAANHEECVHYLHTPLGDGAYLTLNQIPQSKTYGGTVYNKGADMVHTLRGYMGDSLFFHCLTEYMSDFAFNDASSEDLRDYLTGCSGINLSDFFNDWIFNPGWASFNIDSVSVEPGQVAGYDVAVHLRQRLNHAPHYYQQVPLELSFYGDDGTIETQSALMNGACSTYFVNLPFAPVFTGLDLNEKISDAVTADLLAIYNTGSANATYGKMNLNVTAIGDSALIRIEHIYAAPDPLQTTVPGFHLSQERFWKVDGIFPLAFDATANISYNGSTINGGFLDNKLITNSEDSLRVVYRSSAGADWQILTDVTQNFQNSHTDKKGLFTINHLKKGEYAFGIFDFDKVDSVISVPDSCLLVGIPVLPERHGTFDVLPNPADDFFTIVSQSLVAGQRLDIFDPLGRKVYSGRPDSARFTVRVNDWAPGMYVLMMVNEKSSERSIRKLMVN